MITRSYRYVFVCLKNCRLGKGAAPYVVTAICIRSRLVTTRWRSGAETAWKGDQAGGCSRSAGGLLWTKGFCKWYKPVGCLRLTVPVAILHSVVSAQEQPAPVLRASQLKHATQNEKSYPARPGRAIPSAVCQNGMLSSTVRPWPAPAAGAAISDRCMGGSSDGRPASMPVPQLVDDHADAAAGRL